MIADGKLTVFDGDLDDYQQWLKARAKQRQAAKLAPKAARAPRDTLAELRRELEQIERRLATIAREQTLLEAGLDPVAQARNADKQARLKRDAASLEERWLELGTVLEATEAKSSHDG
jgi:ATP-binding cassette subfamily F protein 3